MSKRLLKQPTLVQETVGKLILDYPLYPRHELNGTHVNEIKYAIEAGEVMPPVIAEAGTLRVVDGFHRLAAYGRLFGPDSIVDVELRSYANDADFFLDAVRLNTAHGRGLTAYDQARCHEILENMKVGLDVQASALRLTPQRLADLVVRKTALAPGAIVTTVPIKATARHLAGKQLTVVQEQANDKAGGMNPLFYVNQVINVLQGDLVDWENVSLVEALARLRDILDAQVALHQPATIEA